MPTTILPREPVRVIALAVLVILFAASCYRAATQSLVHDEALTWQHYLVGPFSDLFEVYEPHNHFLHTLLTRVTVGFLGHSELSMRLVSLGAAVWYLSTSFRLCAFVFGGGFVFLLSLLLLALHPLVFDFSVASRGYGLAIACILCAVYQMTLYLSAAPADSADDAGRRMLWKAGVSLSAAVAANLTVLFAAFAAAVVFLILIRPRHAEIREERKKKRREITRARLAAAWHLALPIAACVLLFGTTAPVHKATRADFYSGVPSPAESLRDLVQVSFAHNKGLAGLNAGTYEAVWLAVFQFVGPFLVMFALARSILLVRRGEAGTGDLLLLLASSTAAGAALIGAVTHHALGLPYPSDRTGLYFFPLVALCAAGLAASSAPVIARPVQILSVVVCLQYALQWNVSHFYVWPYDAETPALLEKLDDREGRRATPLEFGVSWQIEPSVNYYRVVNRWTWLNPVDRRGPDGDYDYYLLIRQDRRLADKRGLRVVHEGPFTGTVLAEPATRRSADAEESP